MLIGSTVKATIISNLKSEARIISSSISASTTKDQSLNAEIVRAIVIKAGVEDAMLIPFTSSDLVNGKLIKLHNLNRRIVEVAVTDGNGVEYQPGVNNLADNTRVEIDLTRFDISGTWYLLIR